MTLPSLPALAAFDRHDLIIREEERARESEIGADIVAQQIAKRQKFQHKNSLKVTRGVGCKQQAGRGMGGAGGRKVRSHLIKLYYSG